MAVLYITEYADAGFLPDAGNVPQEPSVVEQTVAIGGSSAQSAAFANNTRLVRIHADAICSLTFGTNPTATATKRRFAAGQTEWVRVLPNQQYKVAVITNT